MQARILGNQTTEPLHQHRLLLHLHRKDSTQTPFLARWADACTCGFSKHNILIYWFFLYQPLCLWLSVDFFDKEGYSCLACVSGYWYISLYLQSVVALIYNQYYWSVSVWITTMLPATQHSLVEFSLLTLFLYIFTLCIYLFCPVLHNLLDKLLNVKQASDMPAVQKSRHRIDPDAIPSPVSFLCACLFLCFILSSPHACTNPQPPPPLPF